MHPHTTWVVIAAYNEETMIGSVVQSVLPVIPHVVVVDDHSRDNTLANARAAGAHAIRHPINLGQGAALRTGMDYALSQGADVIVHFDADGQHSYAEIEHVVRPIIEGNADIVLGSRFLKEGSNVPTLRKAVLRGGILFTWLLSGVRLTDTHNGFRALSRHAAQTIRIHQNRMAHASEIIDEIARHRLRYTEVPVTITYSDYSMARGQSSLNAVRIVFQMLWSKLTS